MNHVNVKQIDGQIIITCYRDDGDEIQQLKITDLFYQHIMYLIDLLETIESSNRAINSTKVVRKPDK